MITQTISKRVFYATGSLLCYAVGFAVLLLASPLCYKNGERDGVSGPVKNLTQAVPPEIRPWALLSPSYLEQQFSERGDREDPSHPWYPLDSQSYSHVYIPGPPGRTVFVGVEGGVVAQNDMAHSTFLVMDEAIVGPPRSLFKEGEMERKTRWFLRPPESRTPNFVLVDNSTACFFGGTSLCQVEGQNVKFSSCESQSQIDPTSNKLICTDGSSVWWGTINIDERVALLLHGGRVWVKERTRPYLHRDMHRFDVDASACVHEQTHLHSIYAVDPHTMEEDFRGSFSTPTDAVTLQLLRDGSESVFVPGCRRPQLGAASVAGGLSCLGASILAWRRGTPVPFVSFFGLSAAFFGAILLQWKDCNAEILYMSRLGELPMSGDDGVCMAWWFFASGIVLLILWYYKAGRHLNRRRGDYLLTIGSASYFLGWFPGYIEYPTLEFVILCVAPLLGLGVRSGHFFPTALSCLGGLMAMQSYNSPYMARLVGSGLFILAAWWSLHRHTCNTITHCHPLNRLTRLALSPEASSTVYFAMALNNFPDQEEVLPFVILSALPLLLVGLWTGRAVPLAMVLVILVIAFLSMLAAFSRQLNETFKHMSHVMEWLFGILFFVCVGLVPAGLALRDSLRVMRNRKAVSAKFRERLTKWGTGMGICRQRQRVAPSAAELAPFFENDEDVDHEL